MASGFYTFDEAANRLGRTKRMVHNYVRDGLLRRSVVSGRSVLLADDVDSMAADSRAPALNKKTFALMERRIQSLEEQVALLRRVAGISDDPLRLTKAEALSLHSEACRAVATGKWDLEDMSDWADRLARFDEQVVDVLDSAVPGRPWEPFAKLASAMESWAGSSKDPTVQGVMSRLALGRRRLREAVLFWTESGGTPLP